MTENLVPISEVIKTIGISRTTADKHIRFKVRTYKIGGVYRYRMSEVLEDLAKIGIRYINPNGAI